MPEETPNHHDCELLTIPELHRVYRLGLKALRRAAARGDFPVYLAGTSWPRVRRAEFEAWLASTRLRGIEEKRVKT